MSLSAQELHNVKSTIESKDLGNNESLEMQWAMKASEHADVYFNLVSSVAPSLLRLTKVDDEICSRFQETFPDMKVDVLDENDMKSPKNKELWRVLMEEFKGKVEDYNYGALLRINCAEGYTQENTMFSVRTQFLAVEIARNRAGLNDSLRSTHGKQKDSATTAS